MLLGALQRELDGQTFLSRGIVASSLVGVVNESRKASSYQQAVQYLMQGNLLCKGGSYDKVRKLQRSAKDEKDIREAAAAFKVLKQTDFYDIMAKTLKSTLDGMKR